MCGIAGFLDFHSKSSVEVLKSMTERLVHRGPDDGGFFFDTVNRCQLGLGHRRLSVLDLSDNGHQPVEFSHLKVVYNGEVYNFKEVRSELEVFGYSFNSDSDTEVILKAYHKWGVEAVHRFNGMFAIAVFDTERKVLTLIRDRAGVKPLYWYQRDGLFLFGSELKCFHEHPRFIKELDFNGVGLFFQYGYIPQPHTIFTGAHKLSSGHYLEVDCHDSSVNIKKYWDVIDCYNKPKINTTEEEAVNEVECLLKSACEYRMVSDVPVGVFLSGGYDSSLVAALLQSERNDKIKTFSIGFHEKEFNEAHHARKVSDYLGTDHTEYYCTQKDALELLPKLSELWDEPFADDSAIPTMLVSALAREKVTVSLSADGGDELFGGYNKYSKAAQYNDFFNKIPFRKFGAQLLSKIPPEKTGFDSLVPNFSGKWHRAISVMGADSQTEVMQNMQKLFSYNELKGLLKCEFDQVETSFDEVSFLNPSLSDVDKMMAIDYKTYQNDDILTKVDRATMAVSLEGREPLLDYRLVEYVSRLEPDLKIRCGDSKYILKKIVHKYLPKEMMDRPKMGFSIPVIDWFGDELKPYLEYYLDPSFLREQNIFNLDELGRIKSQYLSGVKHHASKLWAVLIFQMWYEKWMK